LGLAPLGSRRDHPARAPRRDVRSGRRGSSSPRGLSLAARRDREADRAALTRGKVSTASRSFLPVSGPHAVTFPSAWSVQIVPRGCRKTLRRPDHPRMGGRTMHRRLGRILGLAVVLAGLTALATYGFAASNVEGKVVEIDSAANRVVVETATGSKVIVMSDPQTMILSGNDSKRLSDVHVGDRVKVSYTTAGSTNTATDIELMSTGTMT